MYLQHQVVSEAQMLAADGVLALQRIQHSVLTSVCRGSAVWYWYCVNCGAFTVLALASPVLKGS